MSFLVRALCLCFIWISKCVSFRFGLRNIIGTHRVACMERRGNYKKDIYLYKMIFVIRHVEYVKLCLTWAVNKQLYESFTNMWYSIPDIYCLFKTLNEYSGLLIRKRQIFVVNWPSLVAIHENIFECCFTLRTKTKRSVSVHLKAYNVKRKSKCFQCREKKRS